MKKIPPYNKKLKLNARKNRKEMNKPEAMIWYNILRQKKMRGYRFLRQKPIGNYIVDFCCAKLKLIIEIDGESHEDQVKYDRKRESYLTKSGFSVIHYSNYDVMSNLEGVYFDLEKRIQKREKEINPLSFPLKKGDQKKMMIKSEKAPLKKGDQKK
jgi:very-short-patch-repair endonuclease